ncbi:MAG: hypothetical protein M9891_00435 [Austwickia sp.]|mgnify:CR=1 FL=1|nr:hypothetical protein [Tetrasphaera sp.]MCO5307757.1 hypothetical protein [Austwickia sp.]
MIPKLLHIAWIGEDGTQPNACIQTWRDLNPDFEVCVWNNAELAAGEWRTRSQMKALLGRDLQAVMELVRYEALARFGGVAVDALSIAKSPIPAWLLATDTFAIWADELDEPGLLSTALLGAATRDTFFAQLLDRIAANGQLEGGDPRFLVGSHRLAAVWRETRHPLTVHPSHYLAATYGEVSSYAGAGFELGELIRPPRDDRGADDSFAARQGEVVERLTVPSHIPDAPPLTSSFTLPPLLPSAPAIGDQDPSPQVPGALAARDVAGGSHESPLTWSDIAEFIRESSPDLVAPAEPAAEPIPDATTSRFRVLVATDWSSATVPLAILRAYAQMIPADAPVDLVFAVPRDVTDEDGECARVLLESLGDVETAGVTIESFAEAQRMSCYAAVVPQGNGDAVITEVATTLATLHHLADMVRDPERLGQEPAPSGGPNDGLSRRLAAYREVSLASA